MSQELRNGTIRYYDYLKGEGVIRCNENNLCYRFHFTSIKNISKNNYQFTNNEDINKLKSINNKKCLFRLYYDSHYIEVDYCEIEGI